MNPAARILDGAALPLEVVLDVERRPGAARAGHAHHSGFDAVSITSSAIHDRDRLEDLLETLPGDVYRAKGIVATEVGWLGFHVVGGRLQIEPVDPPSHRETRVVFLGPRVESARMRKLFTATER
jgi:G3E family GTPase